MIWTRNDSIARGVGCADLGDAKVLRAAKLPEDCQVVNKRVVVQGYRRGEWAEREGVRGVGRRE